MKKNEVKVGGLYVAKVSDRIVTVRIDSTHSSGGWNATNTATGKRIRIKSAQRLRGAAGSGEKKTETSGATGKTTKAKAPKTTDTIETAVQPDVPGRDGEKGGNRGGTDAVIANDAKLGTPEAAVANEEKVGTPGATVANDEKVVTPDATVGNDEKAETTGKAANKEGGAEKPATKKAKSKKANGETPAPAEQKPKHLGALAAAAQVLAEAGKPMRARELIAAMAEQGLWSSPAGATPWATRDKGAASRFRKVDRGLFEFNG